MKLSSVLVHRRLIVTMLFLGLFAPAIAGEQEVAVRCDTVVYQTTFLFKKNLGEWIDPSEYRNAGCLVRWANQNPETTIRIEGWADVSGPLKFNERLSTMRARTIMRYITRNGVDRCRVSYEGMGVDYLSDTTYARRASVTAFMTKECVVQDDTEQESEPQSLAEEQVQQSDPKMAQQRVSFFSLRTNLLYWLVGMTNLGVEFKHPNSSFALLINGGYSPFGSENGEYNLGGWFVAPEVRLYIPSNTKWFVGAQFLYSGYNIKLTETGSQGTVAAGGVTGGYRMQLSRCFDMDFSLGIGYGRAEYVTYTHEEGYNVYKERDMVKSSIFPIQAGVNLIWKIQ
ncbi:MAG: DUF3575 domain-containing protein [Rikenellaceae bacterium]